MWDASALGANDAVLFKPNHGTLAGQWFAVIDQNGVAGYQASEDLVIHLENPTHLGALGIGNFLQM